ncbi:MAG: glycosyltransferase [Opitutaceae bacterium]|nr:glycosyltransferase [Opitutaceae bacterium]
MSLLPSSLTTSNLVSSFAPNRGAARAKLQSDGCEEFEAFPIIVFSHLAWDWVWQRPQQYLSRLSKSHPILFVESHRGDQESTVVHSYRVENHPNITVLIMRFAPSRWDDVAFLDNERRRVLQEFLASDEEGRYEQPVLWFYDPMASTAHIDTFLKERAIVYDCMDELSQFKGARPELVPRDRALVQRADVVFCGGRRMAEKRKPLNSNTHFIGTGVDCEHFGKARDASFPIDPAVAALKGPVLGYFGVIDERIDYLLLAALADANPNWSIAMVGPTIKVDPNDFPKRANLHWLGGKPYADLPAITKGFDVCLMPFALNAATEYINPTKALEYMAAGRPVVSTALGEVRSNFFEIARIAESHEEFAALCRQEIDSPTRSRIRKGLALAAKNSWEANLGRMESYMRVAIKERQAEVSLSKRTAMAPSKNSTATSAPSYV